MAIVHVQKARVALSFQTNETDTQLAGEIHRAIDQQDKAASVASNNTIHLVYRHYAVLESVLPSDRDAVVGGLKAWRRADWSTAFGDLADALGIAKDKRKAIAPYVSDLGTALWYGVELTKGERLKTISEIREDIAELREPKGGDSVIIAAVNALAPVRNGIAAAKFTQEDAALACASLTDQQRSIVADLALLLNGEALQDKR